MMAEDMQPDTYPPGFEYMAGPKRVNGFATGDRVQVIAEGSKYYGKFGRVVNSWPGCNPDECGKMNGRPWCALVEVQLDGISGLPGYTRTPMFSIRSITHVD